MSIVLQKNVGDLVTTMIYQMIHEEYYMPTLNEEYHSIYQWMANSLKDSTQTMPNISLYLNYRDWPPNRFFDTTFKIYLIDSDFEVGTLPKNYFFTSGCNELDRYKN